MARETKAQRLEREAAEHAQALSSALCWPSAPEPMPYTREAMDLMTADLDYGDKKVVRAYTYNAYSKRVTHGCFGKVHHSPDSDKVSTQTRGGPWFSSAGEARLAMDWAICRRFAEELLSLRS